MKNNGQIEIDLSFLSISKIQIRNKIFTKFLTSVLNVIRYGMEKQEKKRKQFINLQLWLLQGGNVELEVEGSRKICTKVLLKVLESTSKSNFKCQVRRSPLGLLST